MKASNSIRALRRALAGLSVAAAMAAVLAVPTPATAAPAPVQGAEAAVGTMSHCNYQVNRPYKWGDSVRAYVYNGGCAIHAFALQRHRWFGWDHEDRAIVPHFTGHTLSFYCRGVGTYNYRSLHEGHWSNANASEVARISC